MKYFLDLKLFIYCSHCNQSACRTFSFKTHLHPHSIIIIILIIIIRWKVKVSESGLESESGKKRSCQLAGSLNDVTYSVFLPHKIPRNLMPLDLANSFEITFWQRKGKSNLSCQLLNSLQSPNGELVDGRMVVRRGKRNKPNTNM